MTASILQLVSTGNEDYLLIGNPKFSYFKTVYKRHTVFSIERLRIYNKGTRKLNFNIESELIYDIDPKYGDFLDSIYFQIQLPEINSFYPYKFRWIENIGSMIIDEASFYIDNDLIETLDSDIIHILNTSSINDKSLKNYNQMTCNTYNYFKPDLKDNYRFQLNKSYYKIDSILNENYTTLPSVNSAKIYIKIPFFFVKDKILKLPILKMRKNKIQIKIILKPLNKLYTIGINQNVRLSNGSTFYSKIDENSYNLINYYRYYTSNQLHKPDIYDFVQKNSFNNIDLSLYCYIYFCSQNEKQYFIENKLNILINRIKKYQYLGLEENAIIKVKDNSIVKDCILVPKRDDIQNRNTWSNFRNTDESIDYTIIKHYNNNYLNLCYQQVASDLRFINTINKIYLNYINQLSKFESITINVISDNSNSNVIETFHGHILDNKIYSKYIKTLATIQDHEINPFIYYGFFIKNESTKSDVIVDSNLFRLKLINNNHNYFSELQFKYLPSVIVNEDNLTIDYVNNLYTNSILNENLHITYPNLIKKNQLRNIFNLWSFREVKDIPLISESNIDYYEHNKIIEGLNFKLNGNLMLNEISREFLLHGELYNNYINNYNKDVVRYSFSLNPLQYKPLGHINLESIDDFKIILKMKNILKNEVPFLSYKFNINLYLTTINLVKIENNQVLIQ